MGIIIPPPHTQTYKDVVDAWHTRVFKKKKSLPLQGRHHVSSNLYKTQSKKRLFLQLHQEERPTESENQSFSWVFKKSKFVRQPSGLQYIGT